MRRLHLGLGLLIALLMLVGLFADWIASHYPIAMAVNGRWYVLPALTAPEVARTLFAAPSEVTSALWPPITTRGIPDAVPEAGAALSTWLVWWVQGCRHWLVTTVGTLAIALPLGLLLGALGALGRSGTDALVARATEFGGMLPSVLLVAFAQLRFPGSVTAAFVLTLGALSAVAIGRSVAARSAEIAKQRFVLASRALGASRARIFWIQIVPHLTPTLLTAALLTASAAASIDTALSFLELNPPGAPPSWGRMLGHHAATGNLGIQSVPAMLGFLLATGGLAILARGYGAARRLGG